MQSILTKPGDNSEISPPLKQCVSSRFHPGGVLVSAVGSEVSPRGAQRGVWEENRLLTNQNDPKSSTTNKNDSKISKTNQNDFSKLAF